MCAEISPKEETGIQSIPVALPGQHCYHSGITLAASMVSVCRQGDPDPAGINPLLLMPS